MIKIDLITGFLGSGKTTFIKKYVSYLIGNRQRIGILENDHGAVNVDMLLLNGLRGEYCELEMIAGACDEDCYKRRFKTKLISMAMAGRYDRVVVEPSGIFEMDTFFDIIREEPLDRWYEIGNVIAVVDPFEVCNTNESDVRDYILASEIACAGMVVLSRITDNTVNTAEIALSLQNSLKSIKCTRSLENSIFAKNWEVLCDEDFSRLLNCGYVRADYVKRRDIKNSFSSVYLMEERLDYSNIEEKLLRIINSTDCGTVFRIKGFYRDGGTWYSVNATKKSFSKEVISSGQEVIIFIGENPNEDRIRDILSE